MAGVRKLRSGTWQGWYQHYEGRRAFFTLTHTATRREVLTAAQALEVQHAQIRLGVMPRPDQQHAALARPIEEVITEYLAWAEVQGGPGGRPWSREHAQGRHAQLAWWQTQLQLRTLEDCLSILPSVERVVQTLTSQGLSSQTVKHRRNAIATFLRWCTRLGYLDRHPLARISPLHVTPQSIRRALTLDEIHALLAHAPWERRVLYETAILTGLRVNELRQLTPAHLDFERQGLRLDAAWTKNRRPGFQPLARALLGQLHALGRSGEPHRRYVAGRTRFATPRDPVLYVPKRVSRNLADDLRRAGIPRQTEKGKVDFHALRTTYINLVIASGATVPEAQELARHRTPALTIGVYGRSEDRRLQYLMDVLAQAVLPEAERASGVHAQTAGGGNPLYLRELGEEGTQPIRLSSLPLLVPSYPAPIPHMTDSISHAQLVINAAEQK